jgi:hypothetical protein
VSLANCKANNDTPPLPSVTTVSPGFRRPSVISACQAVTAAQGNVAASSDERCAESLPAILMQDNRLANLRQSAIADFALLSVTSPSIRSA